MKAGSLPTMPCRYWGWKTFLGWKLQVLKTPWPCVFWQEGRGRKGTKELTRLLFQQNLWKGRTSRRKLMTRLAPTPSTDRAETVFGGSEDT